MSRAWSQIVTLWLIGVLAAAQLAKFAVLAPVVRGVFGLSLFQVGLLISLLEVGGALFGFSAGLAVGRVGDRRLLATGLTTLAWAGAAEGLSGSTLQLFSARSVEGIGYLLVVIAAPTLIIAVAEERSRGAALALWSTFVPVGMAFGSAVTGTFMATVGVTATFLIWSAVCLAFVGPVMKIEAGSSVQRSGIALPKAGAWFATLGFGFYTAFVSALTALLPTFLVERGASVGLASLATGIASLAALPGSAVAVGVIAGTCNGARRPIIALILAMLATAMISPFTFDVFSPSSSLPITALAGGIIAFSGVASSIVFARLPIFAGSRSGDDPRVAATNGLVTQFGAAGALVGPPLGAIVVQTWNWSGLGVSIALLSVATLALVLLAEATSRHATIVTGPAAPTHRTRHQSSETFGRPVGQEWTNK
jgi:CP family cyanate transporter-like MFS transporter